MPVSSVTIGSTHAAGRHLVRGIILAFAATALACAAAQALPARRTVVPVALYGMGSDPRDYVSADKPPWRAVGRVQAAIGGLEIVCTGALIAPATVLTAAHCLYNEKTGTPFPAGAFHFLLAFDRGHYAGAAEGVSFSVGPGYDPKQMKQTSGSDWALLRIDQALGTAGRVLAVSQELPRLGSPVTVGGYSRDYLYALTADSHCRIIGRVKDGNGRLLLEHDCTAKQGTSGSPLLVQDALGWTIHGVEVMTTRDETRGFAAIPALPAADAERAPGGSRR